MAISNKFLNEVTVEDLEKREYTVAEAANILGCTPYKVYRVLDKIGISGRSKNNGVYKLPAELVCRVAEVANDKTNQSEFFKFSGIPPKRRRQGLYKEYYRELEVLYELGIDNFELVELQKSGILTKTKISKRGVARYGYSIEEVQQYKSTIDNME